MVYRDWTPDWIAPVMLVVYLAGYAGFMLLYGTALSM